MIQILVASLVTNKCRHLLNMEIEEVELRKHRDLTESKGAPTHF